MPQSDLEGESTGSTPQAGNGVCVMTCCSDADEVLPQLKDKVLMLTQRMGDRSNVVMTRIDDDDLKKIDALVEIEVFRSRSEATAFFVKEGVMSRTDLFREVMSTVEKIRELKGRAKESLSRSLGQASSSAMVGNPEDEHERG